MKFGIHYSQALGLTPTADDYIAVAQLIESLGFATLWVGDHIVIPKQIEASYPYTEDGSIGFDPSTPWPDPFVILAAIAMATSTLRVATGITVLPYRNPIQVAKTVATLDQVAHGRFTFGVGLGWLIEEYAALGVPFDDRGARANEYLRIMKAIWTDRLADFRGRFYTIPDLHMNPQPVQKPHPPIIIGGQSLPAFRRVVEFGDGWQSGPVPLELYRGELDRLRAMMEAHGRTMGELTLSKVVHPEEFEAAMDEVDAYQELGVAELVLLLRHDSPDEARRTLDRLAAATARWR